MFFSFYLFFYIYVHYFYNSKNKGERPKGTSDSDSTSKNTCDPKNLFFYMTLKDNNTAVSCCNPHASEIPR